MKRILNYPGSKWSMARMIIDLMPSHKTYLETHFGSGAVYFNKDKAIVSTINDKDDRLINMFQQLRDNENHLVKSIMLTPYSRAEYELSKEISLNKLEDARRMLVRCWFAIGGKTNADVGWRRNINWNGPYNTYEWKDLPDRLKVAANKLKDAQIECKDAAELVMEHINDSDVLIYADPPYLDSTRVSKHYANEMDDHQHISLLNALKKHSGPVLLSGYDSQLYRDLLEGWYTVKKDAQIGITNSKKRVVQEVVWCNFEPPAQLKLFD